MSSNDTVQLVSGEGTISKEDIDEYMAQQGLVSAGVNYQVVAIMGPQSSGKSTLLNNLFGTDFKEMDAMSGRGQTTKGIWLSRCPRIDEPMTFVMDLEGTDGRERGEDDTSFERQSALFALSVSDILLINIWCHDIGREQGSGKPLMKTVLQVNLKLFTPSPNAKKTVLLFVIRDRSKTPLKMLKAILRDDLDKMWKSITKPAEYEESNLDDFFEVAYTSLPNYEEKEEEFKAETVVLRKRFVPGEEDTLSDVTVDGKLPGNAVALNMCSIWELIKDHKDLNLPAHKVMVANIRCAELCNDQYQALVDDQAWQSLQEEADQKLVEEFGSQASSLLDSVVSGYDQEARYFDAKISSEKRQDLLTKLHALILPSYQAQCTHMKELILSEFKAGMDKGMSQGQTFAKSAVASQEIAMEHFNEKQSWLAVSTTDWTTEQLTQDIQQAIATEIQDRRQKKVSDLLESAEKQLDSTLLQNANELVENMPGDLWTQLDRLYKDTTTTNFQQMQSALQGYEMTEEQMEDAQNRLYAIATKKLETLIKEASHTVLSRMQFKFSHLFSHDEQGLPRTWGVRDDIPKAAKKAKLAAGQVLIQLCLFRVEDARVIKTSKVDDTIKSFIQRDMDDSSSSSAQSDLVTMMEWPDVDPACVLLSPSKVRQVWKQFTGDSRNTVQQAVLTQQANRMASNRMPPIWALLLLVFLGFDEMVAVVYSPVYLIVVLILGAFFYTVWRELDVENEMQKGLLPGVITLGRRFYPTMKKVSANTLNSLQTFISDRSDDNNNTSTGSMQSGFSFNSTVTAQTNSMGSQNGIPLNHEESVISTSNENKKEI
eukprot:TRINITY_DN2272_c1_g1_i2.p1 TRINITY_DN2272_c1_g1~~TRINITY_DN2272_c1_g1_i2.p1  ORF type:complete len:863 (-),score=113.96 TRINITY_DN2272_c1_g1_i2:497-2974(-)